MSEKYSAVQHAGGGEIVSEGSLSDSLFNFNEHVREHRARNRQDITGYVGVLNSIDRQKKIPRWLTDNEPHAIDGSKISAEERKESYLGRYEKEFNVGAAVVASRQGRFYEYNNTIIKQWRDARRYFGLEKRLETNVRAIEEEARKKWMSEVEEMERIQERGGYSSKKSLTWSNIMEDIAERKPLSKVNATYRPYVDVYGVDAFLNSGPSVILGATKWALIVGSISGALKGTKGLIAEMSTIVSTGISFIVMCNFIIFATAIKYGVFGLFSSAGFVFGDRAAKYVKRLTYSDRTMADRRSSVNYVSAFAFSLAPVGFTPYWFFNDVRLGLRYALTGMFVGGLTGLLVSRCVDRLSSVNIQRINATDRQLRRYEALMRRQRNWAEVEEERRKEIAEVERKAAERAAKADTS